MEKRNAELIRSKLVYLLTSTLDHLKNESTNHHDIGGIHSFFAMKRKEGENLLAKVKKGNELTIATEYRAIAFVTEVFDFEERIFFVESDEAMSYL